MKGLPIGIFHCPYCDSGITDYLVKNYNGDYAKQFKCPCGKYSRWQRIYTSSVSLGDKLGLFFFGVKIEDV